MVADTIDMSQGSLHTAAQQAGVMNIYASILFFSALWAYPGTMQRSAKVEPAVITRRLHIQYLEVFFPPQIFLDIGNNSRY
jgi:hypothetical protein